jgi:hypothetical protein
MKMLATALVVLACTVPTAAFATDDYNRTISGVGTQGLGYVQFKEGLSQPCQFGTLYLPDLSQYNARAMMAVLLSAQARGALVSVSYDMNGSGFCTASKVQAQ